jgi:hypothetical protein
LFFSITVVAVLSYTITVFTSVSRQASAAADRRSGDSAMEVVISRLRADPQGTLGTGAPGSNCAGPASEYEVVLPPTDSPGATETTLQVDCVSRATAGNRVVELAARIGGSTGPIKARSLVRITDSPSPGYRITVCDWKLGAISGTLASCP